MKVAIAGGSGFTGKHITSLLSANGIEPVIFTRNASAVKDGINFIHWNVYTKAIDTSVLSSVDGIINLSGAGIADKRWSKSRKQELISSRIETTRFLIEAVKKYAPNCKTLINASAIGIYGADNNIQRLPFTENATAPPGFIEQLCRDWEEEAMKANDFLRVVLLRIGIVLGKEGGAFPKFYNPLKMGIMPILGNGKQMTSWIHVSDLAAMFLFALQNNIRGAYNCVAPHPVNNKALMKSLAEAKGGIVIPVPTPVFALKMAMGEMATEILKSTTVSAGKIIKAGFKFQYPTINEAAKDLIK